jgi:hypothetical protein
MWISAAFSLLHTKWRNKDLAFRPLTVPAGNIAVLLAEEGTATQSEDVSSDI